MDICIEMGDQEVFDHVGVAMDPGDFCLFCFLLDSIEGLATHSSSINQGELEISVAPSQREDWHKFLDIWADYKGQSAVQYSVLREQNV